MNVKNKTVILMGILGLLLSGCGSGGDDNNPGGGGNDSFMIGTAATGKPIAFGAVTLKDSTGATVGTLTDANGDYSIDVAGKTPPYMLRVVPDVPGGIPLYSIAYNTPGTTPVTNITPLTSLIVYEALGRSDLGPVFDSGDYSKLTVSAVDGAHDMVRANFSPQLIDQGLNPADVSLLHTPFLANSSGIDGVLDDVNVSLSEGELFIYGSRGQCVRYGKNLSGITLAIDGMHIRNFPEFIGDDSGVAPIPTDNDLGYVRKYLDETCVLGTDDSLYEFIWSRDPSFDDTREAVNVLKNTLRLAAQRKKSPINIVAHSWGTVIAYIALKELENSDDVSDQSITVKNLVTFGSPIQCLAGGCGKSLFMQNKIPLELRSEAIQKPNNVSSKWVNYWGPDDPISKSISAADVNRYVQCTGRIVDEILVGPGQYLCNVAFGTGAINHERQYFTRTPGSTIEPPVLAEVRSLINASQADSSPVPPVVQPPTLAPPTLPGDFSLTAGTPFCDTRVPAGPATELNWTASTDAISYRVFRNNKAIGVNLDSNQLSFINELGLVAGESYDFKVMALNADGSTWSNTIQVTIPSDVCSAPSPPAPTPGNITIEPASLNFGNIQVGTCDTKSFTIQRVLGTVPISGSVTSSPNPPFSIISGGTFNISGSDGSLVVTVRFCPSNVGPFTGDAQVMYGGTISSNEAFGGGGGVMLTGTGTNPTPPPGSIAIGPLSLNFGNVQVGSCKTSFFAIQHVLGTGPVSGSVSSSPNPPFSIISGGTFNVSGSDGPLVSVRFCPSSASTFTGSATVSSDGTFTGPNTVTLNGTGTN